MGKLLFTGRSKCMKYSLLFLFLMCGKLFAVSGVKAVDNSYCLADSLLTEKYIYEYTFTDSGKARKIIQVMRQRKLASDYVLDVAEGDLLFNNGKYNDALVYYERVLASDSVRRNETELMEQLHRMISCYDCLHDEIKKASYVEQLLKTAKSCDNKAMESVALFNMGKMIYYQGEKQKGYELVNEGIALMEVADYKYKYDNLRYNYNTLLIMQQRDKKYENALETLDKLERIVTKTTDAEPEIDELAEKELKTMYAQRVVILSYLGRMSEADEVYKRWKTICPLFTKDDYLIAPYLMARNLYDDVIRIYASREVFLKEHADTINYHMKTIKRLLGQSYEARKGYKQAAKYFKELAVVTDSLKEREQHSAAMELATAYETNKREVALEKQIAQTKVRTVLLCGMGVAFLLLLILFVRNVQYMHTIRLKNTAMVNTIQELLANKEQLYNIKKKETVSEATEDEEEEYQLFKALDYTVVCDELFLNPDISRDELMKLIHVDKNRFGKIIQRYAQTNTAGYINGKRLEYAVVQMKEYPEYTINFIAQSCGIPNVPTFNRLFREKYGMTPSEFKKQM